MCQERFCFSRSPTCAFSAESAEARPAACGCESRFRKSRLRSAAEAKTNVEQSLETFRPAAVVAPVRVQTLALRLSGRPTAEARPPQHSLVRPFGELAPSKALGV